MRGDLRPEIILISLLPGGGRGTTPAGGAGDGAAPPRSSPQPAAKPAPHRSVAVDRQAVEEAPQVAPARENVATALRADSQATPAEKRKRDASHLERADEPSARRSGDLAAFNDQRSSEGDLNTRPSIQSGEGPGSRAGPGSGTGVGTGFGGGFGTGTGHGANLRAYCLSCPKPHYPRIARARGWEGTVDIEVKVAPDGAVRSASVGLSSGYDALDSAALAVARRSRFHLASPNGRSGIRGRIAYAFKLANRQK